MDQMSPQALACAAMNDRSATELVDAASAGDSQAWGAIVDRYDRLVWSVVRGYRLDNATSADVCQTVWMRLVEHLDRIRDPERLPSWLCSTARNEALRVSRAQKRTIPSDFEYDMVDSSLPPLDEGLLKDEQLVDLVGGFGELDEDCQHLLRLLVADPPMDYDMISELIGRPKGSIGPTRARCLGKLRRILERHGGFPGDDKGPAS
jgi:RNA polymerase sigma factor (sigma-70 family)